MLRDAAARRDASDPLAGLRDEFVVDDGLIYLDGNSLGRLPKRTIAAIAATVEREWGSGLVGSWRTEWIGLPAAVGDRLAGIVGAAPGEVIVADQTSLNLYKLAAAALDHTGRPDVVSTGSNFPSDLYVLEGVAAARGGRVRLIEADGDAPVDPRDIAGALDDSVGLVSLSHIDYRSGAIADMAAITAAAGEAGALSLWDLSHSVGVYPVDLGGSGADLAVGCTYKYLNGGPGAPAFLFVRDGLQGRLRQPIHGWFGHDDQFAFEPGYRPAAGIRRFAVGTPPIVSLRGAREGIEMVAAIGVEAIRAKSTALTAMLIDLYDAELAALGFALRSPRRPEQRGGHVGFAHPQAWQITQALLARDVVPDFRAPDLIRLGPSPLYTRFVDVFDAVAILVEVMESAAYERFAGERAVVT